MANKYKTVWIIMCFGSEGWNPTMDHLAVWRRKKDALWKIRTMDKRGSTYRAFKYAAVSAPPTK